MKILIPAILVLLTAACDDTTYAVVRSSNPTDHGQVIAETPDPASSTNERNAIAVQKQQHLDGASGQSPPILISSDLPTYPKAVRNDHIEGIVEVIFTINEKGKVVNPQIVSSPDQRLSNECIRALSNWRFRPATSNGKPISIQVRQLFPFSLHAGANNSFKPTPLRGAA